MSGYPTPLKAWRAYLGLRKRARKLKADFQYDLSLMTALRSEIGARALISMVDENTNREDYFGRLAWRWNTLCHLKAALTGEPHD